MNRRIPFLVLALLLLGALGLYLVAEAGADHPTGHIRSQATARGGTPVRPGRCRTRAGSLERTRTLETREEAKLVSPGYPKSRCLTVLSRPGAR
jgi:hypothetical protein